MGTGEREGRYFSQSLSLSLIGWVWVWVWFVTRDQRDIFLGDISHRGVDRG